MPDLVRIILLTRNPGRFVRPWIAAAARQTLSHQVLVIDSQSTDGSQNLFYQAGYELLSISSEQFNHGRTRQLGAELSEGYEYLVYMTQDALLKDEHALAAIIRPFQDSKVAAVCGRQVPHADANPIAAHARYFNYPETSRVTSLQDVPQLGIKAAFLSDSFAAYRRSALMAVGGFPRCVIFGEDFQVACHLLKSGWKIAYAADAQVFHSHNYSPITEFRRYFDAGVSHRLDQWMLEMLGAAGGEGVRYVLSELKFLLRSKPHWLPRSLLQNCLKYAGYRMGLNFHLLSIDIRKRLSYDRGFWERSQNPMGH